ncbi:hypothetical protein PAPHI01_0325 [Pancytospora philotis]|nr:hypothetical protein PAPHI01_0325 [Pancytospora philotis]
MRFASLHVLLPVFICGSASTTGDGAATSVAEKKVGKEINPFAGAVDTYLSVRNKLLRQMHYRCITECKREKNQELTPAFKCEQGSGRLHYMINCVIAGILQQDDPVDCIQRLIGRSRLSESRVLEQILDNFDVSKLESAVGSVCLAQDPAALEKICAKATDGLPAIKQTLKDKINEKRLLVASEFLSSHEYSLCADDIMTYIAIRCDGGTHSVHDEINAIMDAIRMEIDTARHPRLKHKALAQFLHCIIGSVYEQKSETAILSGLALDYITSRYSAGLIRLLTEQYTQQRSDLAQRNSSKSHVMSAIIKHITDGSKVDVSTDFVRGYLAAQRKKGRISDSMEGEVLCSFYRCSSLARQTQLLAPNDNFPSRLSFPFFHHLAGALLEIARAPRAKQVIMEQPVDE